MKRFIVSMLCVSIFFIGLGGLVDSVGAKFKSDDRALELMRLARQAVGGEANIKTVASMTATGKATKTFDFEGAQRSEQGDWELNLQLPNKISKMMKVSILKDGTGEKIESTEREIVSIDREIVVKERGEGDRVIVREIDGALPKEGAVIIRKGEGDKVLERTPVNGDAKRVSVDENIRTSLDKMQHNELFRTTLALLLTAPAEANVEYIYAGEGSVDGSSCNIIEARIGETSIKLFLDKSSNLPRMMSYMDVKPLMLFKVMKTDEKVEDLGDNKTFVRKLDQQPAAAEFQIKFSDYRSVSGLQLPFKWTQTVGGKLDETIEISSYEINPANIAEKFNNQPQRVMFKMKKEQ
jgi:hypothetical protein